MMIHHTMIYNSPARVAPGRASGLRPGEDQAVAAGLVERGQVEALCARVEVADAGDRTRAARAGAAERQGQIVHIASRARLDGSGELAAAVSGAGNHPRRIDHHGRKFVAADDEKLPPRELPLPSTKPAVSELACWTEYRIQ